MTDEAAQPASAPAPAPGPAQPSAPTPAAAGKDSPNAENADHEKAAEEARNAEKKFKNAREDPLGGSVPGHALHAARTDGARRIGASQYNEMRDNTIRDLHIGSRYIVDNRAAVVEGPVPADELEQLREAFAEAPGYRELVGELGRLRLLVVSGEPGTGRHCTGLAMLAEVAHGQVHRLDPATDLSGPRADDIETGHGYLLEPAPERSGPETTVLHLDRYAALLAAGDAYGVLLVEDGGGFDALVRSRYGRPCPAPSTRDVLAGHLGALLADVPAEDRSAALAFAAGPEVVEAIGLDELRPAEARVLAGLLADRHRGRLADAELLNVCQEFVPDQIRAWFAEFDQGRDVRRDAAVLRDTAFRLALAVYDGASYDLVAEAAEVLAWELAVTSRPNRPPGRPLATGRPAARLAAARARAGSGTEEIGSSSVPVRTVEYRGSRLPRTMHVHVWDRYNNLRGPVLRWLRMMGQDPRTVVWMRAAVAAGLLTSLDFPFAFHGLLAPLAAAEEPRLWLFAATALDHAATDERVRPAIRALVREWGREGEPGQRCTAAFVHGYGRVAGSVDASLDELRRIGVADDGVWAAVASFNVVALLGSGRPLPVLRRIARWLEDDRRDVADLGLIAVLRLAAARTADVWDADYSAELGPYVTWPLALALVAARPALGDEVADLLWEALRTGRAGAAAADAIAGWLRGVGADDDKVPVLTDFLPQLVNDAGDLRRLRHLLASLRNDPDEPLDPAVARRLDEALKGVTL